MPRCLSVCICRSCRQFRAATFSIATTRLPWTLVLRRLHGGFDEEAYESDGEMVRNKCDAVCVCVCVCVLAGWCRRESYESVFFCNPASAPRSASASGECNDAANIGASEHSSMVRPRAPRKLVFSDSASNSSHEFEVGFCCVVGRDAKHQG